MYSRNAWMRLQSNVSLRSVIFEMLLQLSDGHRDRDDKGSGLVARSVGAREPHALANLA